MDATSFGVLALLVLLGGPLAYFADQLGRKLGKKRLSILGLRPRHTATVLTVAAGILIPLVTVLAMLFFSKDVRTWVIEGSRAQEKNIRLQRDNERLVGENRNQNTQVNDGRHKLVLIDAKYQSELKLAAELEKHSQKLAKQIRVLNGRLSSSKTILSRKEADVRRLSVQVRTSIARVSDINKQLSVKQGLLKLAIDAEKTVKTNFKQLRKEYDLLDADRTKLDKENAKFIRENAQLQSQIGILGPEVDDLKKQRTQKQAELDKANSDLVKAQQDVLTEQTNLQDLRTKAAELISAKLREPMIYPIGAEIVRLQVPAGLSSDDARKLVQSLLSLARVEAAARGAEAHEDNNIVGLANVGSPVPMTPLEVQLALINGATGLKDPGILVAKAAVNVFKTESALLVVDLRPNPLVYRQGEVIAKHSIDGRWDSSRILTELQIFLSEVTQKAFTDHMIPRIGSDAPLGEVNIGQTLDLMKSIHDEARVVRVSAVAKKDTRAGDPLQVEFKIGR